MLLETGRNVTNCTSTDDESFKTSDEINSNAINSAAQNDSIAAAGLLRTSTVTGPLQGDDASVISQRYNSNKRLRPQDEKSSDEWTSSDEDEDNDENQMSYATTTPTFMRQELTTVSDSHGIRDDKEDCKGAASTDQPLLLAATSKHDSSSFSRSLSSPSSPGSSTRTGHVFSARQIDSSLSNNVSNSSFQRYKHTDNKQDCEQIINNKRRKRQKKDRRFCSSSDTKDGDDDEGPFSINQHMYSTSVYDGRILPTSTFMDNSSAMLVPDARAIHLQASLLARLTSQGLSALSVPVPPLTLSPSLFSLAYPVTTASLLSTAITTLAAARTAATPRAVAAPFSRCIDSRSIGACATALPTTSATATTTTSPRNGLPSFSSTTQSMPSPLPPQDHNGHATTKRKKTLRTFKTFDQRIQLLLAFKQRFGHCNVPNRYSDNASLGIWCMNVRSSYWKIQAGDEPSSYKLTRDQIDLLDSIGFCWKLDRHGRCISE